jgi:arginyl-tRNA synthetase
MFKEEIIKALAKHTKKKGEEIELGKPPSQEQGDFAFPCFSLSKERRKSPVEIANDLTKALSKLEIKGVVKIRNEGPYVNFFIDNSILAKNVLDRIKKEKESYGRKNKNDQTIVIEYPSPNTNKPLHLGHIRNMLLGCSVSKLLESQGNKVIQVNLNNDRGVHICKSMVAYQKFGKNQQPKIKTDHFVGKYYVRFATEAKKDPRLEQEAQDMLAKWEKRDKEVRALWKKMNTWAIDGFEETYKNFNISFEKTYHESQIYENGRDIVMKGLKQGVFKKDKEGAIICDLEKQKLGTKVLLRPDGTSVYITQDIYLAEAKFEDFKYDRSIYVVGNEQNYHFKVLFELFNRLKYPFAKSCYHLSYGMISLPEGRMKSREGTVVDADDLLNNMIDLSKVEIRKRYSDLGEKEVEKRATAIGMGALRFFILRYDPVRDFIFNPEESISFEGETGPYVQYTYARIQSIFRKFGKKLALEADYSLLSHKHEHNIITLLGEYPKVVSEATERYRPSSVCRYLLDLCQSLNEYYHECPILKERKELRNARLHLIERVAQVIENGLDLLEIKVLDEM